MEVSAPSQGLALLIPGLLVQQGGMRGKKAGSFSSLPNDEDYTVPWGRDKPMCAHMLMALKGPTFILSSVYSRFFQAQGSQRGLP